MDTKNKLGEIGKKGSELKNKATEIGRGAAKTVETVKGVVQVGFEGGKQAVKKAGDIVNRDAIGNGLEGASKGVDIAAKGAEILADSMKNVSSTLKKFSKTLRGKRDKN